MTHLALALVAMAFVLAAGAAVAAERTVTLNVENMTCSLCPITVKASLEAVPGVSKVDVSFERKTAVVTFDDAKASVTELIGATADAGYPSQAAAP